jgi:hypothetical protein
MTACRGRAALVTFDRNEVPRHLCIGLGQRPL